MSPSIAGNTHDARPLTPPSPEWEQVDDIRALCREARSQLSTLTGLVTKLESKADDLERQQNIWFARATGHVLEGQPWTEALSECIDAWVKHRHLQLQPQRTESRDIARAAAATSPVMPSNGMLPLRVVEEPSPSGSDDKYGGLTAQEYLDRFFPNRFDLPSRLLCGIMESIYRRIENRISYVARKEVAPWREPLKAAISGIAAHRGHKLLQRNTAAFQLVAGELAVRRNDEVPAFPPSKFAALRSNATEGGPVDLILYNTTKLLLDDLSRVAEIFPPIMRAMIEGLQGGKIIADATRYDISHNKFVKRTDVLVYALSPDLDDLVDLAVDLQLPETRDYVMDRLDGASIRAAWETAKAKARARQRVVS